MHGQKVQYIQRIMKADETREELVETTNLMISQVNNFFSVRKMKINFSR